MRELGQPTLGLCSPSCSVTFSEPLETRPCVLLSASQDSVFQQPLSALPEKRVKMKVWKYQGTELSNELAEESRRTRGEGLGSVVPAGLQ